MSNPKGEGGMGFQNFRLFNLALLGKQGWRLMAFTFSPLSLPTTRISSPTDAASGARGISSYSRNCKAFGLYLKNPKSCTCSERGWEGFRLEHGIVMGNTTKTNYGIKEEKHSQDLCRGGTQGSPLCWRTWPLQRRVLGTRADESFTHK
jgi:hypothetical protein